MQSTNITFSFSSFLQTGDDGIARLDSVCEYLKNRLWDNNPDVTVNWHGVALDDDFVSADISVEHIVDQNSFDELTADIKSFYHQIVNEAQDMSEDVIVDNDDYKLTIQTFYFT